ncbi:hypothetical protein L218DRAFT_837518, partial [Marasmius fiardii PR-910]
LWSFDMEGQTFIPKHVCQYLGLPTTGTYPYAAWSYTMFWPTSTYKTIQKWQIDRGFDPKTTDFAQYLQLPLFEVI